MGSGQLHFFQFTLSKWATGLSSVSVIGYCERVGVKLKRNSLLMILNTSDKKIVRLEFNLTNVISEYLRHVIRI